MGGIYPIHRSVGPFARCGGLVDCVYDGRKQVLLTQAFLTTSYGGGTHFLTYDTYFESYSLSLQKTGMLQMAFK